MLAHVDDRLSLARAIHRQPISCVSADEFLPTFLDHAFTAPRHLPVLSVVA
jgi:hypothetical protein